MKHFDNSREGNDCWIYEHWYWHDEMGGFAIKVTKCSLDSHFDAPAIFTGVRKHEMPTEVKEWFRSQK